MTDRDHLTTGQAAEILGTTARHVVNLCLRGDLAYALAGTHRRLRREDVVTGNDHVKWPHRDHSQGLDPDVGRLAAS